MQTATNQNPNAFTGIAGSVTLVDLIQMECSIMATRAVRIDRGEISGRIYFARGQVIHAEVGELIGEPALFEMMRWPDGHVVIADGVHPAEETIDRHWQSLLLAASPAPEPAERQPYSIKPRTVIGGRRRR